MFNLEQRPDTPDVRPQLVRQFDALGLKQARRAAVDACMVLLTVGHVLTEALWEYDATSAQAVDLAVALEVIEEFLQDRGAAAPASGKAVRDGR